MNALSRCQALRAAAVVLLGFLAGSAQASGGSPLSFGKPDFDLTGTVYDSVSKQPIEGAYVVAIYMEARLSVAGSSVWCVKTLGMYTGKDGRYSLPVEKRDGYSPGSVGAIKPGYFNGEKLRPSNEVWQKQDREAYSGRDLSLTPQNPAKPEFDYGTGTGEEFCTHAKTRGDAAAGVEFLKIELAEYVRLGAGKQGINAVDRMIRRLESLPEVAPLNPTPVVDTIK